jgi:RNA-binding protein
MTAIQLNAAQRKLHRADAHHLEPAASIGGNGLTATVKAEIDAALNAHGLVKVRVFSDDRAERDALLARLADELSAAPIQHIGKVLVLWRPIPPPKEKEVRVDRMPGPKVVKILKFSKSGNHRPQVKKIRLLGNQRIAAGGAIKRAKKRSTSPKKSAPQ